MIRAARLSPDRKLAIPCFALDPKASTGLFHAERLLPSIAMSLLPSFQSRCFQSGFALLSASLISPTMADLVAYYQFEGNGSDSIGTANGTVGDQVAFDTGILGQGAVFSTSGVSGIDTIDVPAFDPGDGDFTISFWIKRDDLDTDNADGILDALNNTGEGFQANFRPEPGDPPGSPQNHMAFRIDDSSGGFILIVDPGEISDTENWHHFALTMDRTANQAKIYRDGELAVTASTAILTGTISPDQDLTIGGLNNSGTLGLDGKLDELRFYDEALDAAAIAALAIPPDPVPVVPLAITALYRTDDSVTLTWNSKDDDSVSYRILYSEDLSQPLSNWLEANDSVASQGDQTSRVLSGFELPPLPLPDKLFFVVEEN